VLLQLDVMVGPKDSLTAISAYPFEALLTRFRESGSAEFDWAAFPCPHSCCLKPLGLCHSTFAHET
jgi:hypothetical protein